MDLLVGAVLTVLVAAPMAGLGCTATPRETLHLSTEAREALVRLGVGREVLSLRVGSDLWVFVTEPDMMKPLILRAGQLSEEVGPEYRHTSWVLTDGDAADLYRRITGKKHPMLKGELSEEYKAFLEGDR